MVAQYWVLCFTSWLMEFRACHPRTSTLIYWVFSADGVWGDSRCREDSLASFPCPSHWRRSLHHVSGALPVSGVRRASLSLEMESIPPNRPGQVPQLLRSAHTLHRVLCALQSHFSRVWLSATLWTVALQALCPRDSPARTLEWVAVPCSRGPSRPWDRTHVSYVSCVGRRLFTTSTTGKPSPHHLSLSCLPSSSLL